MRKVKFKRFILTSGTEANGFGHYEEEFGGEGLFHQWGLQSNDAGVSYTIAIVELPDGTLTEVLPQHLKFITLPEAEPIKLLPYITPIYPPFNYYEFWKLPPSTCTDKTEDKP